MKRSVANTVQFISDSLDTYIIRANEAKQAEFRQAKAWGEEQFYTRRWGIVFTVAHVHGNILVAYTPVPAKTLEHLTPQQQRTYREMWMKQKVTLADAIYTVHAQATRPKRQVIRAYNGPFEAMRMVETIIRDLPDLRIPETPLFSLHRHSYQTHR